LNFIIISITYNCNIPPVKIYLKILTKFLNIVNPRLSFTEKINPLCLAGSEGYHLLGAPGSQSNSNLQSLFTTIDAFDSSFANKTAIHATLPSDITLVKPNIENFLKKIDGV